MSKKRRKFSRRGFLGTGLAAGAAGVGVGIIGCKDDGKGTDEVVDEGPPRWIENLDQSEVRWAFLVDLRRCTGCNACSVACKTEYDTRLGVFRNGVRKHTGGVYPNAVHYNIPWICNHCTDAPCLERCPTTAVTNTLTFPSGLAVQYPARATYQRPDGLVQVDQERCVGCGYCVEDCPYGARFLDPQKAAGGDPAEYGLEVAAPKAADKCSLCVHRLTQGVVPTCVNTCPASARMVGNINDPNSEISLAVAAAGAEAKVLLPESQTGSQVYYIGLNEDAYTVGMEPKIEAGIQGLTPGLPDDRE